MGSWLIFTIACIDSRSITSPTTRTQQNPKNKSHAQISHNYKHSGVSARYMILESPFLPHLAVEMAGL
jgi:hypothetical protein